MKKILNNYLSKIIDSNAVMEAVLNTFPDLYVLFEGAGSYDEYIQKAIMQFKEYNGKIPTVVGNYNIAPGKMDIHPDDKTVFELLFKISPDKGIGNGELALYWLFNYGPDKVRRCSDNRGSSNPDLKIDEYYAEVKSYPSHTAQIKLGKFKDDKQNRQLINDLFGLINTFSATSKTNSFLSEIAFNTVNVLQAVESFKETYTTLMDSNIAKILQGYGFYKSIMHLIARVESELGTPMVNDPEEITRLIFLKLINAKLSIKPGNGQFIINLKANDPTDIHVFQVPTSDTIFKIPYSKIKNKISVGSGEIALNYDIFS